MGDKSIFMFFITRHYCILFLVFPSLFLSFSSSFLSWLNGCWSLRFYFSLIHITRQMMFSQNPETKIRFLDSGFYPVSANSRIALSFDLRPFMNDRSKWKKKEGEGEKATTPAYSETIMFDEFGHRYVPFWSVLKGIWFTY